jgi:multiple sugar transport system ATP-binding protein
VAAHASRALELGVRPEHLELVADAGGPRAEVRLVEMAGSESYVHLDVEGTDLVARVPSDRRPRTGESAAVRVQPGTAHVFDAGTGEALRPDAP